MTVRPWPEPNDEPEPDRDAVTDEQIDAMSAEELAVLVGRLQDEAGLAWGLVALNAGILLWVLTRVQFEVDAVALSRFDPLTGEHGVPEFGAAWLAAKLLLAGITVSTGVVVIVRSRRWRVAAGAGLGAAAWWLAEWVLGGLQYGFGV